MCRFLSIFLLFCCFVGSAFAEWKQIATSSDFRDGVENRYAVYVEPSTLVVNKSLRKIWMLTNFESKMGKIGYLSMKAFVELDCIDKRIRMLQITSFAERGAHGEMLFELTDPMSWRYEAPNSVGDDQLKFVCGMK